MSAAPVPDGAVTVDGDRIIYVGPRSGAPMAPEVLLGNCTLAPGLVNAHTHLDLTVFRGLLPGLPFFSWVRTLVAAREQCSANDWLQSARAGIAEGLCAGVTTYADTAPSDASFQAMLDMGVRGIAYREVFGPDPALCEGAMAALERDVRTMRARETALVRVGVSPHAPYSVSDALFRAVADFARREGLELATHVAESVDESTLVTAGEGSFADMLRARGIAVSPRGRSPIALLRELGVLDASTLLIHCVRCDATDVATIARHDCGVATCPSSNAFLLQAGAPFAQLRAAGVRVGVGSDSMASNDVMDVLREASLAGAAAASAAVAAWELATIGGARALRLERDVGSLEVGKQADLTAFPCDVDAGPWTLPLQRRASMVMVAGRVLLQGGALLRAVPESERQAAVVGARLRDWVRERATR